MPPQEDGLVGPNTHKKHCLAPPRGAFDFQQCERFVGVSNKSTLRFGESYIVRSDETILASFQESTRVESNQNFQREDCSAARVVGNLAGLEISAEKKDF
jgi:hypothetical protein